LEVWDARKKRTSKPTNFQILNFFSAWGSHSPSYSFLKKLKSANSQEKKALAFRLFSSYWN